MNSIQQVVKEDQMKENFLDEYIIVMQIIAGNIQYAIRHGTLENPGKLIKNWKLNVREFGRPSEMLDFFKRRTVHSDKKWLMTEVPPYDEDLVEKILRFLDGEIDSFIAKSSPASLEEMDLFAQRMFYRRLGIVTILDFAMLSPEDITWGTLQWSGY